MTRGSLAAGVSCCGCNLLFSFTLITPDFGYIKSTPKGALVDHGLNSHTENFAVFEVMVTKDIVNDTGLGNQE